MMVAVWLSVAQLVGSPLWFRHLPWHFVQVFVVLRGWVLLIFFIPWHFLLHHTEGDTFGFSWNISTIMIWIVMKFQTISGPQRMNPTDLIWQMIFFRATSRSTFSFIQWHTVSQHLRDWLAQNCVQTYMVPRWCILWTLVTVWLFL